MLFRKNIYFNNPDVADLAWAIGSPPLMGEEAAGGRYILLSEEWFNEQFELHLEWIQELEKNPKPLEQWLAADAQKLLGKRFESLLGFWFSHSPYFELLYRNVVLHHQQNTTGEIDFIVKEKSSGNILHIETACKYYLGERKSSSWKNWIGPNGHDSLDIKMKKVQKQMTVFDRVEGRVFLEKEGLEKPAFYFFLKGYFFHHYNRIAGAVPPLHTHRHYNSGWYLYENELPHFSGSLAQRTLDRRGYLLRRQYPRFKWR